jgi:hypothetical protein
MESIKGQFAGKSGAEYYYRLDHTHSKKYLKATLPDMKPGRGPFW